MDELITKLNEVKSLIKEMNVINCTISCDKSDILVRYFSDVPTEEGTEYVRCSDSAGLPYEKRFVNGDEDVVIHTFGTKQDMANEFTGG